MAGKKHPLEIYKKHQGFFDRQERKKSSSVKRRSAGGRKSQKSKNGVTRIAAANLELNERPSTPGDRRVSLSLNNVLIILIIVVTTFIGTYFLGYHKGQRNEGGAGDDGLKDSKLLTDFSQNDDKVQPLSKEEVRLSAKSEYNLLYGIQVATYLKDYEDTARATNAWLQEQGFESRLFPVENEGQYIIIVGSFSDKEDPELKRQLERIRSIDNFPNGDSTPFKTARIRQYKVIKNT